MQTSSSLSLDDVCPSTAAAAPKRTHFESSKPPELAPVPAPVLAPQPGSSQPGSYQPSQSWIPARRESLSSRLSDQEGEAAQAGHGSVPQTPPTSRFASFFQRAFASGAAARTPLPSGSVLPSLTSAEANQTLTALFAQLLEHHHESMPRLMLRLLRQPVTLVLLAAGLALFVASFVGRAVRLDWCFEAVLVLLVAVGAALLGAWDRSIQRREVEMRLVGQMDVIRRSNGYFVENLRESDLPPSNANTLIHVYRDSTWRKLPPCLLVQGDVIELELGDVAPCAVRSVLTSFAGVLCLRGGEALEQPVPCDCLSPASRDPDAAPATLHGLLGGDSAHDHATLVHALGARVRFVLCTTPAVAMVRTALAMHPNASIWLLDEDQRARLARVTDEAYKMASAANDAQAHAHAEAETRMTFGPTEPGAAVGDGSKGAEAHALHDPGDSGSAPDTSPAVERVPLTLDELTPVVAEFQLHAHARVTMQLTSIAGGAIEFCRAVQHAVGRVPSALGSRTNSFVRQAGGDGRESGASSVRYSPALAPPAEPHDATKLVQRPEPPASVRVRTLQLYVHVTMLALTALAFVAGWVHFAVQARHSHVHSLAVLLIVRPAYMLMPLLFWPLFLYVLVHMSNARLVEMFEALSRLKLARHTEVSSSAGSSSSSSSYSSEYTIDEFDEDFEAQKVQVAEQLRPISFGTYVARLRGVTSGTDTAMTRTNNLVLTLGDTTTFCCVDYSGIISRSSPLVDKVLFFVRDSHVQLSLSTALGRSRRSTDAPGHLDLVFVEAQWKSFLANLKPLGLASLLNSLCTAPALAKVVEERIRFLTARQGRVETSHSGRECMCLLGNCIGFSEAVTDTYKRQNELFVFSPAAIPTGLTDAQVETYRTQATPFMTSLVLHDARGEVQLLSRGSPDIVLDHCTDYFNGDDIAPLTTELRTMILQTYASWGRQFCTAISYKPVRMDGWFGDATVLPGDPIVCELSPSGHYKHICDASTSRPVRDLHFRSLLPSQIFLGIVNLALYPKPDMEAMVHELSLAGIRFVFFSPENERLTKNFANKLGLETDFNSCITLEPREVNAFRDPRGFSEMKARLPQGVAEMRHHLNTVDNVPMLVPLFSECTPDRMREVIQIFQEYGETVCCLGSNRNFFNTPVFAQSDVSMGMEPRLPVRCLRRRATATGATTNQNTATFSHAHILHAFFSTRDISIALTALPCSVSADRDMTPRAIVPWIAEGRRLSANFWCALSTLASLDLTLVCCLAACAFAGLPTPLTGFQVLWLSGVLFPLLAGSLSFSPAPPSVLRTMPVKNDQPHLLQGEVVRQVRRDALRVLASAAVAWYVYAAALAGLAAAPGLAWRASLDCILRPQARGCMRHELGSDAVDAAGVVLAAVLVWFALATSAGGMYRYYGLRAAWPLRNRTWLGTCLAVLLAHTLFSVLSWHGRLVQASLGRVPWHVYLVAAVWPALALALNDGLKVAERAAFERTQTRLRFLFNTKLGMHSPR